MDKNISGVFSVFPDGDLRMFSVIYSKFFPQDRFVFLAGYRHVNFQPAFFKLSHLGNAFLLTQQNTILFDVTFGI